MIWMGRDGAMGSLIGTGEIADGMNTGGITGVAVGSTSHPL